MIVDTAEHCTKRARMLEPSKNSRYGKHISGRQLVRRRRHQDHDPAVKLMNLWLMRVCVACLGFATIFGLLVVLLLALGDLRDIWHAKFGENMLPGRTPCNASSEATKLGRPRRCLNEIE